jgi:hypothetical protein
MIANHMARAAEKYPRYHYTLAALSSSAILEWGTQYLRHAFGPRHKFMVYENPIRDSGVYRMPASNSMCLAGDWGTGTKEAALVAAQMAKQSPTYTIHLGDIYYVGDKEEVYDNFLGLPNVWPIGSFGSFALSGNHEAYARFYGYYDTLLPRMGLTNPIGEPQGQQASFFCLENEHWQVIGLDNSYDSARILFPSRGLQKEQMDWLRKVIHPDKALIFLSHHQYYSSFDVEYPKTAIQLASIIGVAKPVLWFWGHEHRLAIYGKYKAPKGIPAFGRCVGHGGMPVELARPLIRRNHRPLVLYDTRQYNTPENIVVGMNGFVKLTFSESLLFIHYYDLNGYCLGSENWDSTYGKLEPRGVDLFKVLQHADSVANAQQ